MNCKKFLAGCVAVFSLAYGVAAADFSKTNTYNDNFTDVTANDWFASSVKDAYELGLMNGKSATTFNPAGTLTVAEGITITSRIHATANGKEIPDAQGEWYQKYVNYAVANGLMTEDQFDSYDINIKRYEIAELFAASYNDLPAINNVSAIPDVASGVSYADEVFKLYNAGILGGNDDYGTFSPNSYLLRSEISAMAVRIADSSKRVNKSFVEIPARAFTDSYYIVENPFDTLGGWDYDNRFDLLNFSGSKKTTLTDVSDEQFYALKRDIGSEYEGILRFEIVGNYRSGEKGIYIAFENKNEERLVELTVSDGKWVLCGIDTVSTGVEISSELNSLYAIVMEIDLDKNTASVIINNKQSEMVNIKPDAVLEQLVIGTNKVGKGYVQKEYVRLSKNYVLDENFLVTSTEAGQKAAAWDVTGDFALANMHQATHGRDTFSLKADSKAGTVSSANKSYDPISGKVVMEAYVLLPEKTDGAVVSFTSGGQDVFKFETKNGGKFYMGETELHEYIPNVWQWLYVEANTITGTATVKINGKKKADVKFDAKLLDGVNVEFNPSADGIMWVDDLEVYPLIEHADYPAYPEVAESTDYNIGLNMCYLWRDQQAGEGWDAMSAFSEFDTYLGFYDDGAREAADWELKLMAEHGIDFIHVCWYTPSYNSYNQTTPIKKMRFSHSALHDGYMNAKYSDLVDFCIMWENSWQDVNSLDQFKEYIWNYWKEHFFSDDRYVRLDNKALITVWDYNALMKAFGGTPEALKVGIDFMNDDIKTLGYDGVIILQQVQAATGEGIYKHFDDLGLDGTYGYHWSTGGGYSEDYQISCNEANMEASEKGGSHHIPTISVGFNNVGRGDTRHPVVSGEGHLKVAENIKDILSGMNTGTWKDNTLIVSTWNEYSEGTYVMPTTGTGFDYLENIRKVFTKDTSDHTDNDKALTDTQLERISRMYPDNRSPIRRLHLEKSEAEMFVVTPDMLEPVRKYDMADGGGKYWNIEHSVENFSNYTGVVAGSSTSGDYGIRCASPKFITTLAEDIPYLHIRMKVSVKKEFEVFFMTSTQSSWSGVNRVVVAHEAENEYCDYYIDMSSHSGWTGEITGIRLDPNTTPGSFEISLIEFMNFKPVPDTVPHVVVNGTELEFVFEPYLTNDGDIAVVAEPKRGFFSSMRVYYEYTRFTGEGRLTLKTNDEHTYVFNVGSDKVLVDGVEKDMGYTLTLRDGLPVFHLKKLCNLLGYSAIITGNTIEILSCTDEEYAKILARKSDSWEFDFPGDLEGFVPQNGKIDVDGESKLVFVPSGADVAVFKLLALKASDYTHIVMGIEYTEALKDQTPQLFFTTSLNPTYGWNADNCINGKYNLEGKKEGDIVEVKFNLADNPRFTGTITGLRFDPISVKEVFKIDYIRCIYDDSIDYASLQSFENYGWEFDTADTGNWVGQNCTLSVGDGTLNGTCTAADIGILNFAVNFNSADAQMIVMGVKYNPEFMEDEPELFFVTDLSTQWAGEKRVTGHYRLPQYAFEGDTIEVVFDLSTNSYFKSNVTSLRIDIHNGTAPFQVDYIRLYKKDGYVPPENKVVMNEATMPTSVKIDNVEAIPNGVKVAGGGAGKLEIVDDPENTGKKVFKVAAAVPGEHFTYLYIYMNFVAGKTYEISYKVYPLQNMFGEDYKTAIAGNLLYGSDGKNTDNHIIDPEHNKETGMGWKEVKTSIVIDADYNPSTSDHFEIWGRPFEGAPVEYLVKDIVIKPAK